MGILWKKSSFNIIIDAYMTINTYEYVNKQNDLSLKWILRNIIEKSENKKLLVLGIKKPKRRIKNVYLP